MRFCVVYNRVLSVYKMVLCRVQSGIARVLNSIVSCAIGYWAYSKWFCAVYNRVLSVYKMVLCRVQSVIERVQNGFVPCTIRYWSCFINIPYKSPCDDWWTWDLDTIGRIGFICYKTLVWLPDSKGGVVNSESEKGRYKGSWNLLVSAFFRFGKGLLF